MLFRIMLLLTPAARASALVLASALIAWTPCGAATSGAAETPARESTAASADTLVVHTTREAELHAPTEKQLFVVAKQLEYAALQFERYTGERAPKTPVYVFASEAQARALAPAPRAGTRIFVWIGPTRRMPRSRTAAGGGPALAAADTTDPEPAFMHAYGHAIVDGWAQRVRRAAGTPARGPGISGTSVSDAAKHATDPGLPPWFQEAIASLCEPVPSQRARVESARAALERRIPFAELLAGPVPADPARREMFVDESLALMRFIVDREEEYFLRQLAVAMVAGKPTSQALVNARVIYSRPEALEKQWQGWMRRAEAMPR